MEYKLLIFARIISILLSAYIINQVRRNLLNEKESLFWVFSSFLILVIAFFPATLDTLSSFIGIQYPPATLFLITLIVIVVIIYRHFAKISLLSNKISDLIKTVALLKDEVDELKSKNASSSSRGGKDGEQ